MVVAFASEQVDYPVIVKPRCGDGSTGITTTCVAQNKSELVRALQEATEDMAGEVRTYAYLDPLQCQHVQPLGPYGTEVSVWQRADSCLPGQSCEVHLKPKSLRHTE
jgi:hypothetical protein